MNVAINRDKVLETAQKLAEKKKYDKAAEELRISRRNLIRKVAKYKLEQRRRS